MTTTNAPNGRAFATAAEVDRFCEPGRYKDTKTPGLYLQVTKGKLGLAKSYFYAFKFAGRSDTLGLGATKKVSLADARTKARAAAALRDKGINPRLQRDAEKRATIAAQTKGRTFKEAAEALIAEKAKGWKRHDAAKLWQFPFEKWVYPVIGAMDVRAIERKHVVAGLEA